MILYDFVAAIFYPIAIPSSIAGQTHSRKYSLTKLAENTKYSLTKLAESTKYSLTKLAKHLVVTRKQCRNLLLDKHYNLNIILNMAVRPQRP